MTKSEYELQVRLLIGHRIAGVRYHEIVYTDKAGAQLPEPAWNNNPTFDSLDYGLDLYFDDGAMCHIKWGAEFEPYAISIQRTPQQYVEPIRVWDVTHESHWQSVLDRGIVGVDLYWGWVQSEGDVTLAEYPQSLRLTFEGGAQVYLSALEARDDGFRMGCMNHVTIFFDRKVAEEYGAWHPRSPHRAT